MATLILNPMRLYAIQATVKKVDRHHGWTSIRQVPVFYLNADVQGIVSAKHAEIIAREIIIGTTANTTVEDHERTTVYASATEVL